MVSRNAPPSTGSFTSVAVISARPDMNWAAVAGSSQASKQHSGLALIVTLARARNTSAIAIVFGLQDLLQLVEPQAPGLRLRLHPLGDLVPALGPPRDDVVAALDGADHE